MQSDLTADHCLLFNRRMLVREILISQKLVEKYWISIYYLQLSYIMTFDLLSSPLHLGRVTPNSNCHTVLVQGELGSWEAVNLSKTLVLK